MVFLKSLKEPSNQLSVRNRDQGNRITFLPTTRVIYIFTGLLALPCCDNWTIGDKILLLTETKPSGLFVVLKAGGPILKDGTWFLMNLSILWRPTVLFI